MKNLKDIVKDFVDSTPSRQRCRTHKKIKEHVSKIFEKTVFLNDQVQFSQRMYCVINDITTHPLCLTCKKQRVNYKQGLQGYRKYCSAKCRNEDPKWQSNHEAICLKKFGVKSASQAKEIKERKRQKSLEKYGTEWVTQSKHFKKEAEKTMFKKYGVKHNSQNEDIKLKKKNKILIQSYSDRILTYTHVQPQFNIEEYTGVEYYKLYKWKCAKCNKIFEDYLNNAHSPVCRVCYPIGKIISKPETELADWIESLGIEIQRNKRFSYDKRKSYEIDIYIPELKMGIEFDGIYWHSELAGKDKNYHLNKTDFFASQNINLIHVFENEWMFKKEIVKSIIKNQLNLTDDKIHARKCEVKTLAIEITRDFLNSNHLQGYSHAKIKLGLYYQEELVSIFTVNKPRFNNNYDYELVRYCNKVNTRVMGGFSKLIKAFKDMYPNKNLLSYVDRRYSQAKGYEKVGFKYIGFTSPNYWYFKNNDFTVIYNRLKFRKKELLKLENFNENLTEWENMQINNYNRIYDCGNLKMLLE